MRATHLILCYALATMAVAAQDLSGNELLTKAIAYHDPNNNWPNFKGAFYVTMETPKKPNRISKVYIDLPNNNFNLEEQKGKHSTIFSIENNTCSIFLDGTTPTQEEKEKYNLNCKRANLYKNYYTYLYGLPMKLKDPGTIIHHNIELKPFKGKTYLALKVTYNEAVGKDTWYFYFNSKTYAMEAYQFYHNESKNDGEYILLSGEELINGIKMPKIRAWHINKNDTLLGTDVLKSYN